jgi:hypothetical protein
VKPYYAFVLYNDYSWDCWQTEAEDMDAAAMKVGDAVAKYREQSDAGTIVEWWVCSGKAPATEEKVFHL